MPKLKTQPWKIGEPQVVYISDDNLRRIVVEFKKDKFTNNVARYAYVELSEGKNKLGENNWSYSFSEINDHMLISVDFVNLLGIPETLEVDQ